VASRQAIASTSAAPIDWWHHFEKLLSLHLPDLAGKTVLDVAASDGYFSFAAERFGAARVVAMDAHAWRPPGGKDAFECRRRILASKVEDYEVDVLDVCPDTVGQFDVVLFLGGLNCVRHPLLALERLASVTKELLVVEALIDMTFVPVPAMAFYPWRMMRDETNWWGPNRAAMVGMLYSVGFKEVVPYSLKRVSALRLIGLPTRTRVAIEMVSSAPWSYRQRLVRDIARSALIQNRLVTHSWR
jgi:tRNA (mo5U34)-methyltransferase